MDYSVQLRPCDVLRGATDVGCTSIASPNYYDNPYEVVGSAVFIDRKIAEIDRKGILWALRVFPEKFILRYVGGHHFTTLDRESFKSQPYDKKQGFSPAMGIKRLGNSWYLNEKILSMDDRNRLVTRLWYALGADISKDLEGEYGFDKYRFQGAFVRYLRARIGDPLVTPWLSAGFSLKGVDPLYQYFLDLMAESESFNADSIRGLFKIAQLHHLTGEGLLQSRKKLIFSNYSSWSFKENYDKLASRGFHFPAGSLGVLSLTLQSARMRGRPESSHRVNVHYYNRTANKAFASAMELMLPGSEPRVVWSPGITATYETCTPSGNKRGAALIGSLLDVGFSTAIGEIGFHSYLGEPVTVNFYGAGDSSKKRPLFSPEWEIGIHFIDRSEDFFMGTMLMVPFLSPQDKYFGFVLRWQEF